MSGSSRTAPHTDPTNPKYLKLAYRLWEKLGRSPTKVEMRDHGMPSCVRVNDVLKAAGLPTREVGAQVGNRNQHPIPASEVEREQYPKTALKAYRYTRPVEDLNPNQTWMK
jgi:hypothetical protein